MATGGARRDALNRHFAEIEKSLQQSHLQQADLGRIGQLKTLSGISSSSLLMQESSPR